MLDFEKVYVHPSQFPERVFQDYLAGFTSCKINHKFHYDSVKQSQKWLKIHETYSPARQDESCIDAYAKCFKKTAEILDDNSLNLNLIGLGCGGGEKDKLLVSQLLNSERALTYYPVDVSLSLAIISAQKIREYFANLRVQPIVCDLLHSDDLISLVDNQDKRNIITFFGMIPNFDPEEILPILSNFLSKGDILLFSANLAPGSDYLQGIQKVLPQYDNELTKEWLITVLLDAGVEAKDGTIKFTIEQDEPNQQFKRIAAYFELENDVIFSLENNLIEWRSKDRIRLFFSYRYTTPMIQEILKSYGIKVLDYWEAANQEEGVYLCQKL
ncbi:L-histidine N(alpha)-methyltransferase [Moorena sp. SIO4A5]|uniref:L-histidine N(alpha)-methyltransferase n=1 Tax=Moorena sp. SIO4A5 TaxID=2607838 RepID=UPI0013CD0E02|nr:L-histidine N(alpha)-methyltransferase [Moorena sp. SIO4A5]NEO19533.1 L-histidine N(alpha)-methyltransferase [Moorena sp. SIO4A5]